MPEFAPGAEKTFSAAARVDGGDLEDAIQRASQAAQKAQDDWAKAVDKRMALAALIWRQGWVLIEQPGDGWFIHYGQSIRLYTMEESTTLPGEFEWPEDRDV